MFRTLGMGLHSTGNSFLESLIIGSWKITINNKLVDLVLYFVLIRENCGHPLAISLWCVVIIFWLSKVLSEIDCIETDSVLLEQVVAITVFFLLAVAFYAFFAPFLGSDTLEYAAIAVYTLMVYSFSSPFFFWNNLKNLYSRKITDTFSFLYSWYLQKFDSFAGISHFPSLYSLFCHWSCRSWNFIELWS